MPSPNPTLISKNRMPFAFKVAASPFGPISRPTHTALIEVLSD